jgi:hypothetical protein
VQPTGEQEVFLLQPGLLDPSLQGIPAGLCDLKLHRTLRLVLHDDGARRHLVAVAHVPDLESDEIAAAQLAVNAEVEQGKLAHPALIWRRTRNAQMSLSLNSAFWPTILPLFHGSR